MHILKNYEPSNNEMLVSDELTSCLKAKAMIDADVECADDEAYGYRVQLLRNVDVHAPFHIAGTCHMQHGLVWCL